MQLCFETNEPYFETHEPYFEPLQTTGKEKNPYQICHEGSICELHMVWEMG